jgi:NagD protein
MRSIPAYDAYIFDLDGTIYLGDVVLPGALKLLTHLRESRRKVAFLSNNPTKTRDQYVAKLNALGIEARLDEVVNTTFVMVKWLKANAPQAVVYPISEQPLIDELLAAGFRISEEAGAIDYVIASFDRSFVYQKLQVAFDAIRAGATLIATNPDRYCPVPGGGEPDAAAIIAAVEACTNTRCAVNVGKPSPIMARTVISLLDLNPAHCIMVGDRLMTDIAMGAESGMATALVLTGDSSRADLPQALHQPTYVIESLLELIA